MGVGWGWGNLPLFAPYPPLFTPSLADDPFYRGYWYFPYPYAFPCYPFASCAAYSRDRVFERRRERFAELQSRAEQQALSAGIETRGGWRAKQQNALSRSTDHDIRPEHLNSGEIRPEYSRSGEYLPEFLNDSAPPTGAQ